MAESSASWTPVGNPTREFWRRREAGWRHLRIYVPDSPGSDGKPRRRYFTRYDYARYWHEQKGLCGLCDRPLHATRWVSVPGFPPVGSGQGIDVDHSHSHGFARSLLHGRCNRMVGLMNSKLALLVLNYLLKHEGRMAVAGDEL